MSISGSNTVGKVGLTLALLPWLAYVLLLVLRPG